MKIALFCFFFFFLLTQTYSQAPDSLKNYSILQLDSIFHALHKNKQHQQMLPYALAARDKAKQQYGEQDTIYARMLYQLGFAFDYNDDFEQGISYYKQAAKIQEAMIPVSRAFANTLLATANIYHYNLKKYKQALPLYLQAKDIRAKVLGKSHLDFAIVLNDLGKLHFVMGNYKQALACYTQTKNIREKALGKNHPDFAASLNDIARLYSRTGNYEKALTLYLQSKDIYEKELGQNHTDFASVLNNLAGVYYKMGNYEQAIALFTQAKNTIQNVLGKEHPNLAAALNNLAGLHCKLGNYEQALPLFIQAKNIREKTLGKEHPEFATSLNNLGLLYQSMGNYEQALPLYTQAISTKEKALGKEHPELANLIHNLGALYESVGQYEQALPLFIRAKDIIEKKLGKEHPALANSLNALAGLYQSTGNYEQALSLFVQAKTIKKKALGKEHPAFATALNNIASLHQSMGNYELALPLFVQAKDIIEKSLGKNHYAFAVALNNIATLHQAMGNYELARPLLIQATNTAEKALGKEHPDLATAIYNLAKLYQSTGDYQLALPLYIQAQNITKKTLGKEHPNLAKVMNGFAKLQEDMGNHPEAWKVLEQITNNIAGINIALTCNAAWKDSLIQVAYPSNIHISRLLETLAIAYRLLEKDDSIKQATAKQKNIADLALALLNKVRNKTTNEQDKLRLLAQSNNWMQKSLNLLNPEIEIAQAFNRADQHKSVLLLQATKSEMAYQLGELPDSLVFKDKKLLQQQSQIQAQLLENRSIAERDSLRNELNQTYQHIDEFEKLIQKRFPKYYQLKYAPIDAQVEDIQALLDDRTALLEYVIADSVVHIFLVDKKEVQWKKFFIQNKILKRNIKALHHTLSQYQLLVENPKKAYNSYTSKAHWFYEKLVQPVLEDKTAIQNLIIVTDGELGHLPFEAFLMQAAPQSLSNYQDLHYLVSDYNISYNYSATLWKENKEAITPTNNGQILAMAANYNLPLDSAMVAVRLPTDQWTRKGLFPIPAARREVETLQKNYQGFFAFDQLASEKTAKEKAPDYAILHFATHGILEKHRPVLSSLAFSEDNDSTESNFWQAHEISKMQLHANLVVLSACETGYGKFEQGNGIASLARAFMYAGASAMIVSLWQVDDYATSKIMKNLYANLANGMEKDEALRQAKIQYMQQSEGILAHPALWSAFVMMGNTEPVQIKKKGNPLAWGAGIGVLVLLGIGVLVHRKRVE